MVREEELSKGSTTVNTQDDKGESIKEGISDDGENSRSTFSVDYSKNGTARCKKCKKRIPKDEIRIGKYIQYKAKYFLQYYHVQCLFKYFDKARIESNIISSIDDLRGTDNISAEEKSHIAGLIDDFNSNRKKLPLRKPVKKKTGVLESGQMLRNTRLKPTNIPSIKVMSTNIDQMTVPKKMELLKRIENEKPLIVAVSEVKSKTAKETTVDCNIPNYTLHPVNISSNTGRGIAVYTHTAIAKSVIQISPDTEYEEACLLEIRLRGGDTLLFCCCYRSPTSSETSEENNKQLTQLLMKIEIQSRMHRGRFQLRKDQLELLDNNMRGE